MLDIAFRVFVYGLVAATSPLALGATLAVLKSDHPRVNGVAYAIGFLFGQSAVLLLAFLIGDASFGGARNEHGTFESLLELAVGIALLATAAHVRARPREPRQHRSLGPRTKAMMERLSRLSPGAALGTGIALGIGGPKRLGITLIVAGAISAAAIGNASELTLAVFYVLVATVLVWVPVALFVVFGTRATDGIADAQVWVSAHQQPLTFYPSLVVGLALVVDGLIRLL